MVRSDPIHAALLDAAPDAIVVVDRDGVIGLVNAQAERLFGYRRDDLVGRTVETLVPLAFRDVHLQHRASYFADPEPRPMGAGMELTGRRADGSEFPAEISLSSIETEDGVLVSAAIRDATVRKRAEAKFRGLLEAAPDAIVGVDRTGVIALVNGQAERLFGYPREELIGQPVEILVPRALRERHVIDRSAYAADPEPRPMGAGRELAGRRRDGTEFPAEISLSSIETEDGVLLSAAIRDVTERKRAEAKFRGLLEAAPDAIVGVDRTGAIALVNGQAERLFGYRREELIGQPVEILVPEQLRDLHPVHRSAYFADPEQRPMGAGMELAGRRRDGTEFPAEISLSAIETEDGLLVSAAIRDVTERIEAHNEREQLIAQAERERYESRLGRSQRLESLGQLAGGVAHDFNNLLAVILNYASFVAEEVATEAQAGDERWARIHDDVEQIRSAGLRASKLTQQLLAFGRREVVHAQVVDLNEVVEEVRSLLDRSIGEHVRLELHLTDDLDRVLADPGRLEQVLVNLAVNARDAMPGGGQLTISTQNQDVGDEFAARRPGLGTGRHVVFQVSDTGTGMDPETLKRVFEPFFTTKAPGAGSGLGLATVYGVISQANGYIEVASELGVGTVFTAYLPATDRPESPAESERVPTVPGVRTILVVEDEPAMREVTRRILERRGHRVVVANSGRDAIALASAAAFPIDVLLTDVIMPEMLGREVAEEVRRVRPEVRVLFMSGYARPGLTREGTLEPGVVLLEKPFTEAGLLARIEEVTAGPDPDASG
jgi:PAS domain S-box-containing protein